MTNKIQKRLNNLCRNAKFEYLRNLRKNMQEDCRFKRNLKE